MQDERVHNKHKQVLDTVEVRRGKLETLSLGTYDKGHEPPVTIEFEPEHMAEYVTVSPLRVLVPGGRYELRYNLQNFGSATCRVTALTKPKTT